VVETSGVKAAERLRLTWYSPEPIKEAMFYWECKRRLNTLQAFRKLVETYFQNTQFTNMGRPIEQQEAADARVQINHMAGDVLESCALVGHSMSLSYTPPPMTGILTPHTVNIIRGLFQFDRLRIPRKVAFDYLDQAIGDYERLKKKTLRQSFNPFYWLWLGLGILLSIPFLLLEAVGFNASKMEESLGGKVFKLIGAVAALLAVLNYLGFSTTWQHISKLVRR
jgi:hypothetical protein